ncbi:MAG: hypothetical protein ABH865_04440 [Candidatus Omnitrophota bacterium]|nr:hypothetical protein [Candidatus Omnitrophota bacterium]
MQFRFRKEDLLIITLLSILLVLELFIVLSIAIFQKLTFLIALFIGTIKVLSAAFLILNIFFLIATLLLKEKKLVNASWRAYLKESMRFSLSASIIAMFALSASAFLGMVLFAGISRLYHLSALDNFIESLRFWVARNIY